VGGGASDFLHSPTVNKEADVHFLNQIAVSDEDAMYVVIGIGARFYHRNPTVEMKPASATIIRVDAK